MPQPHSSGREKKKITKKISTLHMIKTVSLDEPFSDVSFIMGSLSFKSLFLVFNDPRPA